MAYDKYINNYSKDLRIVKNNKILIKREKEEEKISNKNYGQNLIIEETENSLELKAKTKSDEDKIKDIFNNKTLLEKMKSKLNQEKEDEKDKYRHNYITAEERPFIPNNRDNRFKLLIKSKRTKESYLTINQEKQDKKINIEKTNETNFEIKSEYYYIETKDGILPEIIEKKIKETNIINQSMKAENEFKENKTILSSGINFDIKPKKDNNKIQDIESNELSIISNQKKIKKKNEINKSEEIMIKSEPKKWNLSQDLNPIVNEEFSLNNEDEYKEEISNINIDNNLYIESNQLQVIDNINKIKNKQKLKEKIKELNNKIQLIKCNENNINIKNIEKPKVKEIKITTKKILKQEKIISRKRFLKNQSTFENSLFIKGIESKPKINIWNKDIIIPSIKEEFVIKRKKIKKKEQEIQTNELNNKNNYDNMKIEGLDKIILDSKNKDLIEKYLNKLNEEAKKKRILSIKSSNQIQINSDNKTLKKFNNLNIGKNEENEIVIKNNENDNTNKLRAKIILKEKKEVKPNLIETFTFKGNEKKEQKVFKNLDIKKCEGQQIKPTKKLQKNLEKISNEELTIKKQKKQKKETETQIDKEFLNNNLIPNNDIKYKINPIKKADNIIVKNNSINIRKKNNKSNKDLIIVKQKKLNLLQNPLKKFGKETIEPCYSEAITIKTRETYEDPLPNFKLSKKFNKLLISENENLIPDNNINLIHTLSQSNESQFEIIGNKNIINSENKEKDEYIKLRPISETKEENDENNNNDLEKNMTKQFINNMVQNKFELEKKKNMDNTKNKLVTIIRTMKLKNALNKNTLNKKFFLSQLKQIKNTKKILSISNSYNHNYIANEKYITENYTDTDDLNNNINNNLFIDNNTIEIRNKKNKKKILSQVKENDINIRHSISKVDEGIQMSPKKEVKITTKHIFKKEKILNQNQKKNKYIDNSTQTPRLRPKKDISPQNVIFNEIKTLIKEEKIDDNKNNITFQINHALDISYFKKINDNDNNNDNNIDNNNSNSNINNNIEIEKDKESVSIKDNDKLYRISLFNNIFKYFFNLNANKKIPFLRLLCLTKWNHITKNSVLNKSNTKDIKYQFKKYNQIITHRFADFAKKYKISKANDLLMNLFNRRKKEMIKIMKKNKKGENVDIKLLNRKKNALYKLNKVMRKKCGKYVFSLYKRKNK